MTKKEGEKERERKKETERERGGGGRERGKRCYGASERRTKKKEIRNKK